MPDIDPCRLRPEPGIEVLPVERFVEELDKGLW